MPRTDDPIRFDCERTLSSDYVVVVLAGDLDQATSRHVEEELAAAAELDVPLVVVDLDAVRFISSAGLHALLVAARRASQRGGRLTLVCSQEHVLQVLDMTGLGHHLGVRASVGCALATERALL